MQHCMHMQARQHRLSRFAPPSTPQGQACCRLPSREAVTLSAQEGPATLMASATAASHHVMESARKLLTYSRRHTGRTGVRSPAHGAQASHSDAGLTNPTGPLHAIPLSGNSSACLAGVANAPRSMAMSSMLGSSLPASGLPQQAYSDRSSSQVAAADAPSAAVYSGVAAQSTAQHSAVVPSMSSAASLARKLLALRIPGAGAERNGMQGGQEGVCRMLPGNEGSSADAAGAEAPRGHGATAAAQAGSNALETSQADGKACCSGQVACSGEPSGQHGVFKGMVAMVDSAIPVPEADRSDRLPTSVM